MKVFQALIVYLLVNTIRGLQYHISDNTALSTYARDLCTLATPNVTYSSTGQRVNVPGPYIQESLWVGYSEAYSVFSYKGCCRVYDLESDILRATESQVDPGHCWSFCRTRFIGITEFKCYCLEKQPKKCSSGRQGCATCAFPKYTICGRENWVAVYENVQHEDLSDPAKLNRDKGGHCLAYELDKYFWGDCENRFSALCFGESNIRNYSYSWNDAMRECFLDGLHPINYTTNQKSLQPEDGPVWTGNIRSFSIFKYLDLPSAYIIIQGYIQKEDNITTLAFQNPPEPLRALCDYVESSTMSSQTETPSSTSSHSITVPVVTTLEDDSSTTVSQSTIITTSNNTTTDVHTGSSNELKDSQNKNMVAVYVSVPVVVVIVAIVTILIFWQIRKHHIKDNPEQPVYVNSTQQAGTSTMHTDDVYLHPYDARISDDSHEHQYTVLDHRSDNAIGTYTNVDHTYTNQHTSTEHVYENK